MTTREVFERGTSAFNAHDIDGFAEVLHDEVEFKAPGVSGRGKAACAAFYRGWLLAFPDAHVDVQSFDIVGDTAVEKGTFTGTHNGVLHGPSGPVSPTGRSVRLDYLQLIRFRDSKHVSFHLAFDRLLMLEQLGLIPEPALGS